MLSSSRLSTCLEQSVAQVILSSSRCSHPRLFPPLGTRTQAARVRARYPSQPDSPQTTLPTSVTPSRAHPRGTFIAFPFHIAENYNKRSFTPSAHKATKALPTSATTSQVGPKGSYALTFPPRETYCQPAQSHHNRTLEASMPCLSKPQKPS